MSVLIGILFMGDVITPEIAIGALLSIGGVGVVALAERRLGKRRPINPVEIESPS